MKSMPKPIFARTSRGVLLFLTPALIAHSRKQKLNCAQVPSLIYVGVSLCALMCVCASVCVHKCQILDLDFIKQFKSIKKNLKYL